MTTTVRSSAGVAARSRRRSNNRPVIASGRIGFTLRITPILLLALVFFIAPIALVFFRSMHAGGMLAGDFTVENYAQIIRSAVLRNVVVETLIVSIVATAISFAVGFPVAFLLTTLKRGAAGVILALIMLPFLTSILVRLYSFQIILGREGLVNAIADAMGLGGAPYSLLFNSFATVVGMVNYNLPFMVLMLYGGLAGVDTGLLNAARSLGCSARSAFLRVYVPLVRPTVVSAVLVVLILSLGFMLTPVVLGGPANTTIAVYIQQELNLYKWGTASAIGTVLLVVSLIIYGIATWISGPIKMTGDSGAGSKGGAGRAFELSRVVRTALWAVTVLCLAFLIAPLAIIVPTSFGSAGVLRFPPIGFTTRWYESAATSSLWMNAVGKSIWTALLVGALTTATAYAAGRAMGTVKSARFKAAVQSLSYAPVIVPAILLSIGIFDVSTRLGLTGTTVGLVFAHWVIAFPFAFAIISAGLGNLDANLEEAARTMGLPRYLVSIRVVLPNMVPALAASFSLSFLTSWDDVVIALFQTGMQKTLPVMIFSRIQAGVEPTVPAIATMLIVVIVVGYLAAKIAGRLLRKKRLGAPCAS